MNGSVGARSTSGLWSVDGARSKHGRTEGGCVRSVHGRWSGACVFLRAVQTIDRDTRPTRTHYKYPPTGRPAAATMVELACGSLTLVSTLTHETQPPCECEVSAAARWYHSAERKSGHTWREGECLSSQPPPSARSPCGGSRSPACGTPLPNPSSCQRAPNL